MLAALLAAALAAQNEELVQAVKKSSEMENYSFKIEAKAAKGKKGAAAVEGRYEKDQPVSLKSAAAEGFKKAGVLVAKDGEEYKKVERPKKGEKKEASPALPLLEVKLPHEELEGFEKNFEKVEKAGEKENECVVWTGALTTEGARRFGSTGSKAEAKANYTYAGTAKVWVNAQGFVTKYQTAVEVKGEKKNGGEVDLHVTRTVELREIGTTKVEIPDAAKKALEGQP